MLKWKTPKKVSCYIILLAILCSIFVNYKLIKKNHSNELQLEVVNKLIKKQIDNEKKFNFYDMIKVFDDNDFNLIKIHEDNNKDRVFIDVLFNGNSDLLESKLYKKCENENLSKINSINIVNIGNNKIEATINMEFIKNK